LAEDFRASMELVKVFLPLGEVKAEKTRMPHFNCEILEMKQQIY
jgi:hypothetical protein